jgi:hypothetical protein
MSPLWVLCSLASKQLLAHWKFKMKCMFWAVLLPQRALADGSTTGSYDVNELCAPNEIVEPKIPGC